MSDPFVAEIRMFGFNFAPNNWATCDGQLMPLSQNTALFALLGTFYGGDGKSTFRLPDLQGRAPMHWGQGPGLSLHDLGEAAGSETVTLLESEMPSHAHTLVAVGSSATQTTPGLSTMLADTGPVPMYAGSVGQVPRSQLSAEGNGGAHNNMQPYQVLNFCICLRGVFPPRG